jgi:hypothetical protein
VFGISILRLVDFLEVIRGDLIHIIVSSLYFRFRPILPISRSCAENVIVIVARQFTIYQLANTIIYDLPKRVQLHRSKIIVITGLLDQFYQDPYINIAEAERLVSQIVTALHKIKNVFVVLTSRMTDSQIVYPAHSRIEIRAKQVFDEMKLNFSIYNKGRLKKVFMTETELRIV